MKTQEEIEQMAINEFKFILANQDYKFAPFGYVKGYLQCLKDNDWTKNCSCEHSIGQTWCCNQCGLPYSIKNEINKL